MPIIRTVAQTSRFEIPKIKGSRFFATLSPAPTLACAKQLVTDLWREFSDATHQCWAWRGRTRDCFRYADDGEPNGSAGRPILAAVDGQRLCDVCVVVTRYYGGTKLGTGGLVRAYGFAAAEVIAHATIIESATTTRLRMTYGYPHSGAVDAVLHAYQLTPTDASFTGEVSCAVDAPEEQVDALMRDLRERCSGQIHLVAGQS